MLDQQRKEILLYAKEHLLDKSVSHNKIKKPITFTVKGFKEAINQNHDFLVEKNELIKAIDKVIPAADYVGSSPDVKGRLFKYHYLKTKIKGKDSFITIRENITGREAIFWTIVDTLKKG